jgi:glycosyltransferase involved in cell wall biosynthesis
VTNRRPLRIFISHPSHFLTDSEPHGDGLLAFHFIERLARRGHELHIAVPIMSIRNSLPSNVHLYPLESFTRTSTVNPPSLNRLEYAFRVRMLLRRLQNTMWIDLIHQLNPVVPGMSLLLSRFGIPIVLGPLPPRIPRGGDSPVTVEPRGLADRVRDAILHRQLRDATLILIPTSKSLEIVPKDPAIRRKVRALNYGVDTEVFQPAAATHEAPSSILYLANLVRRKGILVLVEAFERLAELDTTCVLQIAGAGPDETEIRARVARSPAVQRIQFLGNIVRRDVPAVLNACTVYCLPSYDEPFGMTALEAMACGKPVVGSRTGGLGLLLDDSGSRKVEPGNFPVLAAALHEVLSSKSLRASMGSHNRRRAETEFSWGVVIDRLEDLYAVAMQGTEGQGLRKQKATSPLLQHAGDGNELL